jgi:hypothetical protein
MDANANVIINASNVHEGGSQVAYLPPCKAAETLRDTHILKTGISGAL